MTEKKILNSVGLIVPVIFLIEGILFGISVGSQEWHASGNVTVGIILACKGDMCYYEDWTKLENLHLFVMRYTIALEAALYLIVLVLTFSTIVGRSDNFKIIATVCFVQGIFGIAAIITFIGLCSSSKNYNSWCKYQRGYSFYVFVGSVASTLLCGSLAWCGRVLVINVPEKPSVLYRAKKHRSSLPPGGRRSQFIETEFSLYSERTDSPIST